MRVQPDEAIWMKMNFKEPGLHTKCVLLHAACCMPHEHVFEKSRHRLHGCKLIDRCIAKFGLQ